MLVSHLSNSSLPPASGASGTPNAALEDSPTGRKLRKAAGDFEAILLANWWSSMKQSGLPGGEDDSDPGKDTLDQMGLQAMCAAVSKAGGLGIAEMLVRSLLSNVHGGTPAGKSEETHSVTPASTGS
jgi:Rod binding domain-containing protein